MNQFIELARVDFTAVMVIAGIIAVTFWLFGLLCRRVYESITKRPTAKARARPAEYNSVVAKLDREIMLGGSPSFSRLGEFLVGQFLASGCIKAAVVGSVRRGEYAPNDLDILVVGTPLNVVRVLEFHADDEHDITKEIKPRSDVELWKAKVAGKRVHVIRTTEDYWGIDMLYFTGSRWFSELWQKRAERRGYGFTNGRLTHEISIYNSYEPTIRTELLRSRTEDAVLKLLGLEEYADPTTRSEPHRSTSQLQLESDTSWLQKHRMKDTLLASRIPTM